MTVSPAARWFFGRAIALPLTACLAVSSCGLAWAGSPCPIPGDLALREISLPAARQAVMRDKRLVILTLGGAHTAGEIAGSRNATYPGRLEAGLTEALPQVAVSVVNEASPGKTAADIPPTLAGLIEKTGARLVVWGPGGQDLARRLEVQEYQDAVAAGIEVTRRGGADLILLDTTYVPSPTRMAMIEPYRDRLRRAAEANRIPFLSRHDLMLRWSKDGTLNLEAREQGEQVRVARRLFSCVAESLTGPIVAAVR